MTGLTKDGAQRALEAFVRSQGPTQFSLAKVHWKISQGGKVAWSCLILSPRGTAMGQATLYEETGRPTEVEWF